MDTIAGALTVSLIMRWLHLLAAFLCLGGMVFATVALKRRFGEMRDRDAFREVDRYQRMVKEYRAKIQETVEQSS